MAATCCEEQHTSVQGQAEPVDCIDPLKKRRRMESDKSRALGLSRTSICLSEAPSHPAMDERPTLRPLRRLAPTLRLAVSLDRTQILHIRSRTKRTSPPSRSPNSSRTFLGLVNTPVVATPPWRECVPWARDYLVASCFRSCAESSGPPAAVPSWNTASAARMSNSLSCSRFSLSA